MSADLAALESSVAATYAELNRLLAASYRGVDRARLVTAVVDGHGLLVEVTFAKTVARHDPAVVAEAVRDAVADAQLTAGTAIAAAMEEVTGA
ncbi:YbaB/EbfC family nucleoid-associated protein [Asanoa siamensis]|uniref:YbaB/EbfC DNA-binding family protein n=1 Tax=Asanoa siamensis TaxID=926357 RepID=A0ABQ4CR79_9ACTN|nr:YbaB/EbfC family nucleoid-associated protein [Asanoa siamensis]GIF73780.1 hypothetical protein Asi02nite_32980 [Asanoa siamensis]